MKFNIFTLHPDIFSSFLGNSLIARAISKQIIEIKTIDWRQDFGIGNYKQVDDKPFGGGSGMVLMADPIINAMMSEGCFDSDKLKVKSKKSDKNSIQDIGLNINLSLDKDNVQQGSLATYCPKGMVAQADWGYKSDATSNVEKKNSFINQPTDHQSLLPNNSQFYEQTKSAKRQNNKVNVLMTPRGFPLTQQVVEWLALDFEEINILCGRYEGFDTRINDHVDLELSIGNFVLNGGEVGAMCLVEAVSRLVPDFITKNTSVLHDSFSSGLNNYNEFEFENSKLPYQRELEKSKNSEKLKTKNENLGVSSIQNFESNAISLLKEKVQQGSLATYCLRGGSEADGVFQSGALQPNLFNNAHWLQNILPHIEHPQYTRPNIWQDPITNEQKKVPEVLLLGNHSKIQKWRVKWW
jgi:tRNA G37 N-methylase TrmD